jgi:hypothetical protein
MAKKTAAEPRFSVDYSQDELAVIAGLLTIEAMPGAAPASTIDDGLRSAAARSLVARRVLEFTDDDGIEITQPHATVLSLTLVPSVVVAFEQRTRSGFSWLAWYLGEGGIVQQEPVTGAILRYTLVDGFDAARVTARLPETATHGDTGRVHMSEAAFEALLAGDDSTVDLPAPLDEAWADEGRVGRVRLVERVGTTVTIDDVTWLTGGNDTWRFRRDDLAITAEPTPRSELASQIGTLLGPAAVAAAKKPPPH